jgi:hypothetical protein
VSPRGLVQLLRVYVAVVTTSCLALMLWMDVDDAATTPLYSIASVWQDGVLQKRALIRPGEKPPVAGEPSQTVVIEDVVDTGPLPSTVPLVFAMSFVPGRDGIEATYRGRTARVTADDLVKAGAYDHLTPIGSIPFRQSVDPERAFALLAHELGTTPVELVLNGSFRRLVFKKRPPTPMPAVTRENLRAAALAAGRYLARNVLPDGSYR